MVKTVPEVLRTARGRSKHLLRRIHINDVTSWLLITDKRFTESSYSHQAKTNRQNERAPPSLYHPCVPFADRKWRQIPFPSLR